MNAARLVLPVLALIPLGAPAARAQNSETGPDTAPRLNAPANPATPGTSKAIESTDTKPDEQALLKGEADSDVCIAFSPYIWLTGFSGDVGVRNIDVNLSKNFFQILDESDSVFGLMGALDLSYKKFVFQYQGSWVTSDFSREVGNFDTGSVKAELELEALWNEVFVGFRLLDEPLGDTPDAHDRVTLDPFCGGRFSSIDADATLTATSQIVLPDGGVINPGASVGRDQSESWFEPFIGARAIFELDEHWVIQLRGDVGGFGVDGSDFAWQTIAVVGYKWRNDGWEIGLFGGYRALGQDYSSGDFRWDMITHGPVIGGSIRIWF